MATEGWEDFDRQCLAGRTVHIPRWHLSGVGVHRAGFNAESVRPCGFLSLITVPRIVITDQEKLFFCVNTILRLAIALDETPMLMRGVQASLALILLSPIRRSNVMPWIIPRPFRRKTCPQHAYDGFTTPIALPFHFPAAQSSHVAIVLVTDSWGFNHFEIF